MLTVYMLSPMINWIKTWVNVEEEKKIAKASHPLDIIGCIIEESFHFDQFIFPVGYVEKKQADDDDHDDDDEKTQIQRENTQ